MPPVAHALPAPSAAFECVSFRFPEDERAVVRALSLELSSGAPVAVVGPGAEALVGLLAGRLEPTVGRVRTDGPVVHLTPKQVLALSDSDGSELGWRRCIARAREAIEGAAAVAIEEPAAGLGPLRGLLHDRPALIAARNDTTLREAAQVVVVGPR